MLTTVGTLLNWRKFGVDVLAIAALILLFEALLNFRGLPVSIWSLPGVLAFSLVAAWATQKITLKGSAVGGWIYPLIFLVGLYLSILGVHSLAVDSIYNTAIDKLQTNYAVGRIVAERFKDAYIVLGSAAFTLIGLFFIVLRIKDFQPRNASRLITISEAFAAIFLLSMSALLFRDETWWRWVAIAVLNGTTLLVLLKSPEPYIIDFEYDPPVVIFYWGRWDDSRRGWAEIAALGLFLIPMAPVVGESLFFFSLLYLLYLAAHAAVFLYVSTEVKATDLDATLRGLFRIEIPPAKQKQIAGWKAAFHSIGVGLPGVDQVPFIPIQPPTPQTPQQQKG